MLSHESELHSFLWLNNIPQKENATFCYHPFIGGQSGFHFLATANSTATNIHMQVFA